MEDATTVSGFGDAVGLGEAASFGEVVLPLQSGLMRVAVGLTRDGSEARDLVQDTIERALREWARFTPGTNARAWMTAILSRLFIDGWRRRRRRPALVGIDDFEPPAWTGDHDDEDDASFRAWDTLTDADLEWAVAALPEPLRRVFELNVTAHLSYGEIAATLGIPTNTVGTRLLRARRRLRVALQTRLARPVSFKVDALALPAYQAPLPSPRSATATAAPQSARRSMSARASTAQGVALESRPM
jgi:RNA polymerase sigma-70 factor (ECF subfamily)